MSTLAIIEELRTTAAALSKAADSGLLQPSLVLPLPGCTPPPWKAWDRGIGWEIHGPDDEAINGNFRECFTEEDAYLASASHELLEVTVKMLRAFEYLAGPKADEDPVIIAARAAVAKASGQNYAESIHHEGEIKS